MPQSAMAAATAATGSTTDVDASGGRPPCGPARVALGAAATTALAIWLLIAIDVFPNPGLTADVLQTTASGLATLMFARAALRPNAPLGSCTAMFAMGSGAWFLTDLAWTASSNLGLTQPDALNAGYALATMLWGVSIWVVALQQGRVVADDGPPRSGLSVARAVMDAVLIAAGVIVWWVLLVWSPLMSDQHALIALGLTLVDVFFLGGALLLWARARPGDRFASGMIAFAAIALLATDYVYARDVVGYTSGGPLDVGWFSVSALLVIAGLGLRRSERHRYDLARWAQPLVAPAVVLVIIGDICIRCGGGQMDMDMNDGHRIAGVVLLLGLLVVRHVLVLAEHFDLSSRTDAIATRLRVRLDHDDLTGLYSRTGLRDRTRQILDTRRTDGQRLALVWVDVDAFRRINDLLGHSAGDEILRSMADRLRACAEPGDVIGRYGGDQFVIVRPLADETTDDWADHLRDEVTAAYEVDGTRLHVTASVGLLDADGTYDSEATLLSDAELAMDRAKQVGGAAVERFRLGRRSGTPQQRQLALDLRTALEQHQFDVHYQPVFDLVSGRPVGAEALIRFEHPTRGSLSPGEFLPVATAIGMMPELATLVLNEACATFANDRSLGWVAVNLDEAEIADPRLLDAIENVLARTGLDPDRLTIEINERVVPRPDVVRAIDRLTELGVGLALDDFGSSWSSLGQVQKLPLRMVKIDRSVVAGLETTDHDQQVALLSTMVSLADAMGVVALAEGIETSAEFAECLAAGVRFGQGFLWAPALPISALVRYVDAAQRQPAITSLDL